MGKQVFLELTTEENLKKLNIDPRLVDSFKRVMSKIQVYFDSHGYSDKIDFETIVNDYLLPKETIDRDAIRHSAEFIKELNDARETQKQLEAIVSITLEPIEEEIFLDEYINKNYDVGLCFKVDSKENDAMHNGIYKDNMKTIEIRESVLSSTSLDRVLCHEFMHFLTMCGKEKLGSVEQTMTPATYEPLTEMLACDVLGIQPDSYKSYRELIEYVNLLVGVDNYDLFIQRQLDPKYEAVSFVFEDAQNIMDKHRFSRVSRDMEESELDDLIFSATTHLLYKDYESVEELSDDMVKIYSSSRVYSNLDGFEKLQDGIVDLYLSEHQITNPDAKSKIMQLIRVKNERRVMNGMNCIPLIINGDSYLFDEDGNLYLKRLNTTFKYDKQGMLISYQIVDGVLRLYTESGTYNCDLKNVDFKALGNNLANQQEMLEREINTLMRGESMNRPYINPETVSTVVARDTGAKSEVMEPIQSKSQLRRPHIKKETMYMLQGKIKSFELDTKKKQLLAQKEMVQQMMANQQMIANQQAVAGVAVEEEEEHDMGMSM